MSFKASNKKVLSFIGLCTLSLTLITPAAAQQQTTTSLHNFTAEEWVINKLPNFKHYGRYRLGEEHVTSINQIEQKYLEFFDQTDHGFDGITKQDQKFTRQQKEQHIYAGQLVQWMKKDLDRNLEVSKKELTV